MLSGGEGVQICRLGILSTAKHQGWKQMLKNLITFVSISCNHLIRAGLGLLLIVIGSLL